MGSSLNYLPDTYRISSSEICLKNWKSTQHAIANSIPKLSLALQRTFAAGGFNKIARGSREVNAVGPIINLISKLQHSRGIFGSLGETGVHHGRFTGFLFVTARRRKNSLRLTHDVDRSFHATQCPSLERSASSPSCRWKKQQIRRRWSLRPAPSNASSQIYLSSKKRLSMSRVGETRSDF